MLAKENERNGYYLIMNRLYSPLYNVEFAQIPAMI